MKSAERLRRANRVRAKAEVTHSRLRPLHRPAWQSSTTIGSMDPDERLEELIQRHEALTRTVETLAAMHRENEERFARFQREVGRGFDDVARHLQRVTGQMERLTDILTKLVSIVEFHENRITGPVH